MRLGYLVPEFPSQTHAFFWREVTALRSKGIDVRLVSTRKPRAGSCPHSFAAEAESTTHYLLPLRARHAVNALRKLTGFRRNIGYFRGLSESTPLQRILASRLYPFAADLAAWTTKNQIDHLHVHSCAQSAHLAALSKLLGGAPYSLTLHGGMAVYGRDHASKVGEAEFIAVVTKPLQREVCETVEINEAEAPIIPMGIDARAFRQLHRVESSEDCLRIITVARLCPSKGHTYALQAIREMVSRGYRVTYKIVGEGPAEESIRKEVASLGLDNEVELTGSLSESDVMSLLAKSDVFALTSVGLGEAAPVSVMEAMAASLPVVSSRIGGTPDMITAGHDGYLIDQRDVQSLVECLSQLRSPAVRGRMGAAARSTALNRFDVHHTAQKLIEEIESSLQRRNGRRR